MRLGVKLLEINVLCRKLGGSAARCGRLAAIATAFAWALPTAQSSEAVDAPLRHCWKQAETRVELAPCLRKLLLEAEDRLAAAQAQAVRAARELDRVTAGSANHARTLESDSRWRGYRDSECSRQSQAMSPGTGSGDVFAACKIILTHERVEHLGMP
ncbi:MAG: DUF1311 domain-containing protein [Gammaproteobacteria bacterium]|nr:DUF1311 domain-containing protein [Gammaproteobacteria bacterium]NIM74203.1 DUF1311 domain-containing protein [Gammaproteobacteria bacterium]NIN39502.1 DUF1311 domain-containing protein [Gammaproteobacteria bacterium]NIO25975.1 DUF1311 domain-containing protein [Gammaproteobacteria bacterium]NIO66608.1 DUF1311 domain-containing protein [Gammaproteobacteria bacterium]